MNHLNSMVEFFSIIPDPRRPINLKHELSDILVLSIVGILAGCDSCYEIERFGEQKEKWLKKFLKLENGIPSHDTIGRVMSLIDPEMVQVFLQSWAQENLSSQVKHVAIDGKTFNGSSSEAKKFSHLGMVSAYSSDQGLCLGYEEAGLKNEKKGFEQLIRNLDLKGTVVTMDSNGLTSKILLSLKDKKANFIVAVKDQYAALKRQIIEEIENGDQDIYEEKEVKSHGRREKRVCVMVKLGKKFNDKIKLQRKKESKRGDYPEFKSCMKIISSREVKGKRTVEERYYISDTAKLSSKRSCQLIRSHWEVENKLHWCLDVAFREDNSTIKDRRLAKNFGGLRRFALNLFRLDKSRKGGPKVKRQIAGWNHDYLYTVLEGGLLQ